MYVGQLANSLLWLDTNTPHTQTDTHTHTFPGGSAFPSNVVTTCAGMKGIKRKERKKLRVLLIDDGTDTESWPAFAVCVCVCV